jgi:hypothetical protein
MNKTFHSGLSLYNWQSFSNNITRLYSTHTGRFRRIKRAGTKRPLCVPDVRAGAYIYVVGVHETLYRSFAGRSSTVVYTRVTLADETLLLLPRLININ